MSSIQFVWSLAGETMVKYAFALDLFTAYMTHESCVSTVKQTTERALPTDVYRISNDDKIDNN